MTWGDRFWVLMVGFIIVSGLADDEVASGMWLVAAGVIAAFGVLADAKDKS